MFPGFIFPGFIFPGLMFPGFIFPSLNSMTAAPSPDTTQDADKGRK
jgi:hypothetical protein